MSPVTPELPLRGPSCPAPATLEALSAGEPQPNPVTTHVPGCPQCRGYVSALVEGREAFLALRPAPQFLRKLEARPKPGLQPRPWLFGLGALVAAGLALMVVPSNPATDGVVLKGPSGPLQVVYLRPGAQGPQRVERDMRLKAGDALRFTYNAPTAGHLLILDLDGTGKASVFVPFDGQQSKVVRAAHHEPMPGSVILDDAPGPEWIVAVFSPRPLQAAPLLAALEAQSGATEISLTCDGCTVTTLRIQKSP
jgi:hypothetical protein